MNRGEEPTLVEYYFPKKLCVKKDAHFDTQFIYCCEKHTSLLSVNLFWMPVLSGWTISSNMLLEHKQSCVSILQNRTCYASLLSCHLKIRLLQYALLLRSFRSCSEPVMQQSQINGSLGWQHVMPAVYKLCWLPLGLRALCWTTVDVGFLLKALLGSRQQRRLGGSSTGSRSCHSAHMARAAQA